MTKKTLSVSSVTQNVLNRAEQLDTIASVLPIDRRDKLAEILTDQDVETLRHLINEGMGENTLRALTSDLGYLASRHESVGSVRLLRTYGDHAARIDVSRRNGLRSTPSVGVQM